jgi:ferric-dicitrate binding protein FerR (iron transport regulator)
MYGGFRRSVYFARLNRFSVKGYWHQEAAMKMTSRTVLLACAVVVAGGASGWLVAQETGAAAPGQELTATTTSAAAAVDNGALPGDSHVRIVRLSDVKGSLGLDRKTGHGFEQTMQNMPIVEGEKLQTADGFAEVEFEDNSTLRLAPNSLVEFPLLALRSTGAKASTMNVVKGTVYVSTENTKGNEFELVAGQTKMSVSPSTHLRLEVNETRTVVSVFNGSVEVQRGGDMTVVDKKESLTLGADEMSVAKKVAEEPFDAWDKDSNDYHQRYSQANAFAGGGNSFGLSDLNYYGSFTNAGGCGQMWQPYLVSASWSPYANGLWTLYPGAGYSWVSPYPWGWLPYHSGSWAFCQGVGWGWQPGGNWYGLNNIAGGNFAGNGGVLPAGAGAKSPLHAPLRPVAPTVTAGAAKPSLVLSNTRPIVFSKEDKPGNFVFQKDSAGLGVPRGSLGNLNRISNDVGKHGSANMEVYVAGPGGRAFEGNEHGANRGPATFRAGSADGSMTARGMEQRGTGASPAMSASRQGSSGVSNQGSQGSSPSFHSAGSSGGGAGGSPASAGGGGGGGSRGSAGASPK